MAESQLNTCVVVPWWGWLLMFAAGAGITAGMWAAVWGLWLLWQ